MDIKVLTEIKKADEESLCALANKGLYKRACKDTEGMTAEYDECENGFAVRTGGEECTIVSPLSESRCTCPSRTICRHILAAVLLLQKALPDAPEPLRQEETPPPQENGDTTAVTAPDESSSGSRQPSPGDETEDRLLDKDELDEVHACARACLEMLGSLLSHGVVRASEQFADSTELLAVRCHAARMADGERLMREVGSRLTDCIQRSAAFDIDIFTQVFCKCTCCMRALLRDELYVSELGVMRRSYDPIEGRLDILPIGERQLVGGDHEGNIYYFLNVDNKNAPPFLSFSEIRPVYYEKKGRAARPSQIHPWGLGSPIKKMMTKRMVLDGARLSGGKLSSSAKTAVTAIKVLDLNIPALLRLIVTDAREMAVTVGERMSEEYSETDRMFIFRPKEMKSYGFDKFTQTLDIYFEDIKGNTVRTSIKYRAEFKLLFEQIERICERMKEKQGEFSMLCTADIRDGELVLFPIEFYPNIVMVPELIHDFELPEKYVFSYSEAMYAADIGELLNGCFEILANALHSGTGSVGKSCEKAVRRAESCGMTGLSRLMLEFLKSCEEHRNKTDHRAEDILSSMEAAERYIEAGKRRTGIISALFNMSGI